MQRVESNSIQNSQLETLRDYLLPKLISGELRISEAQTLWMRPFDDN